LGAEFRGEVCKTLADLGQDSHCPAIAGKISKGAEGGKWIERGGGGGRGPEPYMRERFWVKPTSLGENAKDEKIDGENGWYKKIAKGGKRCLEGNTYGAGGKRF